MRRPSRLAAVTSGLLSTALVAVLLAPVALAQSEEARLSAARSRLAELEAELDEATGEAKDADAALRDADERLREMERIVDQVAADVEDQRRAVSDAQLRLEQVQLEVELLEELFADRVARLFKQGPALTFELLFASEDAGDAVARSAYLRHVSEGDRLTIETLDAAKIAVEAEHERVVAEQRRLEDLLAEQQAVLADVERLRDHRALAAADARVRVEQLAEEHDDLEAEQQELEALIRERQERERQQRADAAARRERETQAVASTSTTTPTSSAPSAPSAATTSARPSSSGFAWPLCAPVTSEYGPRWGRMHRGIDQGASTGTPIGASKAGTVIFAGWQGGYGQLVLVDHHDGVVTAYAHMSSIGVGVGASVSQGQTLGRVGSTGNSTGPHLHFETRVNGNAVNPRQYLSGSAC